ncbi:hypothetical protein FA95DRAFT_646358 [Auriscalpium vulgare]|uniref:Uncharacterized protein n=1 Tax=Auriscalpium vulgare TaxID=40419 RepID=A0ACB8S3I2_9AGAM|nr:hypothetical protein FA95DRAFT_646358 [Auriscalpium vulgare]
MDGKLETSAKGAAERTRALLGRWAAPLNVGSSSETQMWHFPPWCRRAGLLGVLPRGGIGHAEKHGCERQSTEARALMAISRYFAAGREQRRSSRPATRRCVAQRAHPAALDAGGRVPPLREELGQGASGRRGLGRLRAAARYCTIWKAAVVAKF